MAERTDDTRRRVPVRAILDVVASVAMIGAAGLLAWTAWAGGGASSGGSTGPTLQVPAEPLSLDGSPVLGSATAPVALIAFSDFECPYCSRFANESLPALKEKYMDTGQVQLAFRHLPLPNHSRAVPAAVAAECAARQGRFWPLHDRFFATPGKLTDEDLRAHASAAGVDLEAFEVCLGEESNTQVSVDTDLARALQVRGTPAFFAGRLTANGLVQVTQTISGARPLEDFERVLDALIEQP